MQASGIASTEADRYYHRFLLWLDALTPEQARWGLLFLFVVSGKIVTTLLFSSGYKEELFVPFVTNFVSNGLNPWNAALATGHLDAFPYPPLMLYILSIVLWPLSGLTYQSHLLENLFFKLPTIAADVAITWLLIRQFPNARKGVLLFYFCSPVIWFASYAHAQLDLIPTALLFAAVDALARSRPRLASLLVGLALCTKFHTAAALPLLTVFCWKRFSWREGLWMALLPLSISGMVSAPYLNSSGYRELVLNNAKQLQVFEVFYSMGNYQLCLPLFMTVLLYARFVLYRKINQDLLVTFLGILFAIFILLIHPSPAWYVWLVPFLAVFSIKTAQRAPATRWLWLALNSCYLIFFLFAYQGDYQKLTLMGSSLFNHLWNPLAANTSFTFLEASLAACIYAMYRFGVRSNAFYQRQGALLIGVAGDSGSGKTVLASDLKGLFQNELGILEGDGDHRWERHDKQWKEITPLNAKANFLHDQANDLVDLHLGKTVYRRDYDHSTGRFTNRYRCESKTFMLLSGLHSFYLPKMRKIIDLKIYLEPTDELRRFWKCRRDLQERGYQPQQVDMALQKRQGDAVKYIHPQKQFADLIIQYVPNGPVDLEDAPEQVSLYLKVSMDANISLDPLLYFLRIHGHEVEWEYESNLEKQYLLFRQPVARELLQQAAQQLLPNMDDFVPRDALWAQGYRGMVQLLTLLMIHTKMLEGTHERL